MPWDNSVDYTNDLTGWNTTIKPNLRNVVGLCNQATPQLGRIRFKNCTMMYGQYLVTFRNSDWMEFDGVTTRYSVADHFQTNNVNASTNAPILISKWMRGEVQPSPAAVDYHADGIQHAGLNSNIHIEAAIHHRRPGERDGQEIFNTAAMEQLVDGFGSIGDVGYINYVNAPANAGEASLLTHHTTIPYAGQTLPIAGTHGNMRLNGGGAGRIEIRNSAFRGISITGGAPSYTETNVQHVDTLDAAGWAAALQNGLPTIPANPTFETLLAMFQPTPGGVLDGKSVWDRFQVADGVLSRKSDPAPVISVTGLSLTGGTATAVIGTTKPGTVIYWMLVPTATVLDADPRAAYRQIKDRAIPRAIYGFAHSSLGASTVTLSIPGVTGTPTLYAVQEYGATTSSNIAVRSTAATSLTSLVLDESAYQDKTVWPIRPLGVTGAGTASIPVKVTGSAGGTVEARLVDVEFGTLTTAWTSIGKATGSPQTLTLDLAETPFWANLEVRFAEATAIGSAGSKKIAAGYVIQIAGQSEFATAFSAFYGQVSGSRASVSVDMPGDVKISYMDAPIFSDYVTTANRAYDIVSYIANRFSAIRPHAKASIVYTVKSGTGPDQLMDDTQTSRLWSDDIAVWNLGTQNGLTVPGIFGTQWIGNPAGYRQNYGGAFSEMFTGRRPDGSMIPAGATQTYRNGSSSLDLDHTWAELYGAYSTTRVFNAFSVYDSFGYSESDLRPSWLAAKAAVPHLGAIVSPRDGALVVPHHSRGRNPADWQDAAHPTPLGGSPHGARRFHEAFVDLSLAAYGIGTWPTCHTLDPAQTYWDPSGSYVEVGIAGKSISTIAARFGETLDPSLRQVIGFAIDGVSANNVSIVGGKIRIAPNSGTFTSSTVITRDTTIRMAWRGGVGNDMKTENALGWWKAAPVVVDATHPDGMVPIDLYSTPTAVYANTLGATTPGTPAPGVGPTILQTSRWSRSSSQGSSGRFASASMPVSGTASRLLIPFYDQGGGKVNFLDVEFFDASGTSLGSLAATRIIDTVSSATGIGAWHCTPIAAAASAVVSGSMSSGAPLAIGLAVLSLGGVTTMAGSAMADLAAGTSIAGTADVVAGSLLIAFAGCAKATTAPIFTWSGVTELFAAEPCGGTANQHFGAAKRAVTTADAVYPVSVALGADQKNRAMITVVCS